MNNNLRWKEYYGGPFHTFQNRRFLISHHDVAASGIAAPTSILLPNPGYTAIAFWPSCMRISISPRLDTTDSSCCFFDSIPFRLWDSATYMSSSLSLLTFPL